MIPVVYSQKLVKRPGKSIFQVGIEHTEFMSGESKRGGFALVKSDDPKYDEQKSFFE